MILPYWHKHVSERQPGAWIDCTWDSGVEFVRLTHDKSIPATHAEGDALRKASGDLVGGSNIGDLRKGIRARYGYWTPLPISGFAALWAALKPGTAAVVQGSMAAFGPSHRLSRFDPTFDGGHASLVIRLDGNDRVWWCDPEGPATGYIGEWMSKAELSSFVKAFAGQHIVAPILGTAAEEDIAMSLKTYTPGYTADVKAGSNVRAEPKIAATKLHATTTPLPVAVIGTVAGDVDPANGSNVWYALWHDNRVEYTAKDNVINLKAPVASDDGYTKATQDAAVAEATAKATAAEKERIAIAVGAASASAIRDA